MRRFILSAILAAATAAGAALPARAEGLRGAVLPETKRLGELLIEFQHSGTHVAAVLDEYGSTVGIVTLEDLLEEIVGEITDEFDVHETKAIEQTPAGDYMVDGTLAIRSLNRALDWNLPDEEANTVAGLVIHAARLIPEVGAAYDLHGFRFEVVGKEGNRLTRLHVSPLESPAADPAD
jgi:Mg2+/Co2+ transporter CorB